MAVEDPAVVDQVEAAAAARRDRIELLIAAFQRDPANRDRALAETHVMLSDIEHLFSQAMASLQGGGLSGLLGMFGGARK